MNIDAKLHKHIIGWVLPNNRGDIKGALYNRINVSSGVQVDLLAVAKLLNAKIVVFVKSNQVKAWLNRKEDCCWDLRFIWNRLEHDRSKFKSICFAANKNT